MSKWVRLEDWIEIKVSGPETIEYLNGIITKDLTKVASGKLTRSAFLTPSAKVRSIFWLKKDEDNSILFYCHPSMKQALIEDLLKYKLSMDVKLEDITEETPDLYLVPTEEKIPGLSNESIGFTIINLDGNPEGEELEYSEFVKLLVNEGISPLEIMEGENPYELGIDDIIHLEKGCFLGQEPISRMYHRGNPRKYIYQIDFPEGESFKENQKILQEDNEVGELLIAAKNTGLAFIRRTVENLDNLKIDGNSIQVKNRIGTYPKNDR